MNIIRVGVFGSVGSGKTRFIDTYLNRSQILVEEEETWDCSSTIATELYYKQAEIETTSTGEDYQSALVEIEDTPGSTILAWKQHQANTAELKYNVQKCPVMKLLHTEFIQHDVSRYLICNRI